MLGLRYGLITGAALVVYGVVFTLAGFHYASPMVSVFYLLLLAGVILTLFRARKPNGSWPNFLQATVSGLLVCVVAAFLYSSFVYVYNEYIDDSLIRTLVEDGTERLIEQGLEGRDLEEGIARIETFGNPETFAIIVFVQLVVFGAVSTLIVAAFSAFWTRKQYV